MNNEQVNFYIDERPTGVVAANAYDALYLLEDTWGCLNIREAQRRMFKADNHLRPRVAIIDTNLDRASYDLWLHDDNPQWGVIDAYDYINNTEQLTFSDSTTHGGAMSRNIAAIGTNPDTNFLHFDMAYYMVMEGDKNAGWRGVESAIYRSMENNVHVINFSAGSPGIAPEYVFNAIASAREQGIQFNSVTGNTSSPDSFYPGAFTNAYATSGTRSDGGVWSKANGGADVFTVVSGWGGWTGTSTAASILSGIQLLQFMREDPTIGEALMEKILRYSCEGITLDDVPQKQVNARKVVDSRILLPIAQN